MKKFFMLCLLPLGTVCAEPGDLTQYLMREPATLFDIGMVRLETLATEFENHVAIPNPATGEPFQAVVSSEYDSAEDRIYVGFMIMNSEATDSQLEEACGASFRQMGIWLTKSLTSLFSHVGPIVPSTPENLLDGLSKMVVMTCYVSSGTNTAEGRFWASLSHQDFLQGRPMRIGRWN